MTLEELKKLISKDETKNIEPQNEHQNEHQNEPQKAWLRLGRGVEKWSLGSQIAVLTVVKQKTIFSIKFSPT